MRKHGANGVFLGLAALGIAAAGSGQTYPTFTEGSQIMLVKVSEITSGSAYYTTTGSTRSTAKNLHMHELRFSVGLLGGGAGPQGAQLSPLEQVGPMGQGGGGSGGGGSDYTTVTYQLGVVHVGTQGELPISRLGMTASAGGALPVQSANVQYGSGTGIGMMETWSAPDNAGVEVMADPNDQTASVGGTIINVIGVVSSTLHHWNGTQWVLTTTTTHQTVTYQVEKLQAQHNAAIDSRLWYGDPDKDGAEVPDPNSQPRNPSFPAWIWKGGLFVGNMAVASGDQSATARTQFDIPPAGGDNSSLLRACALSCYNTGSPSNANGSVTIGLCLPSGSFPTTWPYTWQYQWPVSPSTPVDQVSFSSSSTPGYCTWSLMQFSTNSNGQYVATLEGMSEYFALCILNESTFVSGNNTAWQYFASPAYQALYPTTALLADSQPRVWNIYALATATW